jgi:hypothetical protein
MEKKPIKKKCWCGNAFGQCHQPIEEKWKEEFNKKFCSKTSEPKYSVWNAAALAYPEEIKSFIENLLEQEKRRISDEIEEMKTYTGGSSVNEKDKRVNKQEVLSIINK